VKSANTRFAQCKNFPRYVPLANIYNDSIVDETIKLGVFAMKLGHGKLGLGKLGSVLLRSHNQGITTTAACHSTITTSRKPVLRRDGVHSSCPASNWCVSKTWNMNAQWCMKLEPHGSRHKTTQHDIHMIKGMLDTQ